MLSIIVWLSNVDPSFLQKFVQDRNIIYYDERQTGKYPPVTTKSKVYLLESKGKIPKKLLVNNPVLWYQLDFKTEKSDDWKNYLSNSLPKLYKHSTTFIISINNKEETPLLNNKASSDPITSQMLWYGHQPDISIQDLLVTDFIPYSIKKETPFLNTNLDEFDKLSISIHDVDLTKYSIKRETEAFEIEFGQDFCIFTCK